MATISVLIPDRMKAWVEARARTERFSNASNYVRDLIQRDQERTKTLADLERLVDQGAMGSIGPGAAAEILDFARQQASALPSP